MHHTFVLVATGAALVLVLVVEVDVGVAEEVVTHPVIVVQSESSGP